MPEQEKRPSSKMPLFVKTFPVFQASTSAEVSFTRILLLYIKGLYKRLDFKKFLYFSTKKPIFILKTYAAGKIRKN